MKKQVISIQLIYKGPKTRIARIELDVFAKNYALTEKRAIERKAALFLVRNLLDDEKEEILHETSGRPYLKENKAHKISVSHSFGQLILSLTKSTKHPGVDIEKVRPKILTIKEKFMSQAELDQNPELSELKLTLYWSAKEALYKAAGLPGLSFASQVHILPFSVKPRGGILKGLVSDSDRKKKYTLRYQISGEYVLVYTVDA